MNSAQKTELQEELTFEEKEDGSVSVSLPPSDEPDNEAEPEKKTLDESSDDDDDESHDESDEKKGAASDDEDEEFDARLEAKRERRRLEKKARYERAKRERESDKLKIQALERQVEEMASRVAQVDDIASSFKLSQADKKIEDLSTQVEYAKIKLTDAINAQDAHKQAELLDILADLKADLKQAKAIKDEEVKSIKNSESRGNVQTSEKAHQNELKNTYATQWMRKHSWFDPHVRDTDSKIAKLIDQEISAEGIYQPHTQEYWDELTLRCEEKLGHRFMNTKPNRRSNTTSSRSEDAPPTVVKSKREFYLSPARKQAIMDAGAWNDPVRRQRMIRSYMEFDKRVTDN